MVGGGIKQPQGDVEGGGYQGGCGLQFRVVREDWHLSKFLKEIRGGRRIGI